MSAHEGVALFGTQQSPEPEIDDRLQSTSPGPRSALGGEVATDVLESVGGPAILEELQQFVREFITHGGHPMDNSAYLDASTRFLSVAVRLRALFSYFGLLTVPRRPSLSRSRSTKRFYS